MERLPAKKVRIKDILEGKFFYGDKESLSPSFLITKHGIKVSRANILGTIIDKFVSDDESYLFYVIDDGTGEIRVKFFREMCEKYKNAEIGDLVIVIGKVREYMGEIYLNGEILRKVDDPNYETYRKLEIVKQLSSQKKLIESLKKMREEMSEEEFREYAKSKGIDEVTLEVILKYSEEEKNYKERLIYLIKEMDKGDGVGIEQILDVINLPIEIVESTITQLLDEGYIYEPSPGKFRVVKE